ncbi:MAG TPA: 8-amino-7-oxononanoate synthase [Burkholderiales bacterium]|jgi:8-amino-7-oxononanoate synthase|nr:8-amino-7-oxononanoate synthase [Burkholderiales bacterium]
MSALDTALDAIRAQLDALTRAGLARRRVSLDGAQRPRVSIGGETLLSFCSNDYLGLAADERIGLALIQAVQRYGVGSGGSHLVIGHTAAHDALERDLADFTGQARALFFGSGYLANMGVLGALAGREDVIVSDALNHASLIDGMRLTRARVARVPHCDVAAVGEALAHARDARARFVVTEGVFSMDGDTPDIPALLELCDRFDAWLVIDDAHGFGVLGRSGGGVLRHFDVRSPRIVYVGTLGKAAGVSGAFAAAAEPVIELILQRARSYIYTTASPAFVAAALQASLAIIREEGWRREKLGRLTAMLKTGLEALPAKLGRSQSAIQPLILGDNARAIGVSEALRRRGVIVSAIRPPTVPEGTARLRISLSAAHEEADVRLLLECLAAVMSGAPTWQPVSS